METKTENEVLKEELETSATNYIHKLEADVHQSVEGMQRIAVTAIAVGSVAVIGYSLFRKFFKDKPGDIEYSDTIHEVSNSNKPDFLHTIASLGAEMAANFLLTYARGKLIEYIKGLDSIVKADETAE